MGRRAGHIIIVHEMKADKTIDRHSRDERCGVCVRMRKRASACVRQTLIRRIQNTSYLMQGDDASEARSRARGSGAAAEAGKQAAARERVSLDVRRGILASGVGFVVRVSKGQLSTLPGVPSPSDELSPNLLKGSPSSSLVELSVSSSRGPAGSSLVRTTA